MVPLRNITILFLFVSHITFQIHAADISGNVRLDHSWERIIYLSLVPSFDDLYTASYDFLVDKTEIDSLGNFEMKGISVPSGYRLYRLHICKKGDPVSTIMIGGAEENFIHFFMRDSDQITIFSDPETSEFHASVVEGDPINRSLLRLFRLRKDLLLPPSIPSTQNRALRREKVLKDFRTLADTSSYQVIKLLTVHMINESFVSADQLDYMKSIASTLHISDTSDPYYREFINELDFIKYQHKSEMFANSRRYLFAGGSILLVAVILIFLFNRKRNHRPSVDEHEALVRQLSVQEKRVLDLLKSGKSNKEIARELNIEVSTVKSHLNKIYGRLNVKNRKEILHRDW